TFLQGDEVILRASVVDSGSGQPVSGATVHIRLSASGWFTDITSGPSNGSGVAEAVWKTAAPKGNRGGTQTGTYTAAVQEPGVTGDGLRWDGVGTVATFSVSAK
ncbi:MAG TPA: hypothetical protein VE080_00885, partial [Candidatus Aquicultoraceae bacterium]|nr:hypothetical protein [Candidatus Aquicultoraceae bacterium]